MDDKNKNESKEKDSKKPESETIESLGFDIEYLD